jgi:hypothetical protein
MRSLSARHRAKQPIPSTILIEEGLASKTIDERLGQFICFVVGKVSHMSLQSQGHATLPARSRQLTFGLGSETVLTRKNARPVDKFSKLVIRVTNQKTAAQQYPLGIATKPALGVLYVRGD